MKEMKFLPLKIYKKRLKTVEWPFWKYKTNQKVTVFNTIALKRTKVGAKLLAISHI